MFESCLIHWVSIFASGRSGLKNLHGRLLAVLRRLAQYPQLDSYRPLSDLRGQQKTCRGRFGISE